MPRLALERIKRRRQGAVLGLDLDQLETDLEAEAAGLVAQTPTGPTITDE